MKFAMNKGLKAAVLLGGAPYEHRVRKLLGSSLIAYFPLTESGGSVVHDTANGFSLSTSGSVTLGGGLGLDNRPCALLSGGNIPINLAGISSAWGNDNFTVGVWFKASRYDLTTQDILKLFKQTASQVIFRIVSAGNQEYVRYGTEEGTVTTYSPALLDTWGCLIVSKSGVDGKLRVGIRGQIYEFDNTSTWEGTGLTTTLCFLGGSNAFYGQTQHLFIANREATKAEMKQLSAMRSYPVGFSILGDSISTADGSFWHASVFRAYNAGNTRNFVHSVAGKSIMNNLDDQAIAAANDDADKIIITLGTNDDNAGDMAALQAKIESNIIRLRASNPRAVIYYMGVLPSWTDNTGATPKAKSNIRAAQAAACLAQGATFWDTFTTPWITAAQTSDGVHPIAAGHSAITSQVMARV